MAARKMACSECDAEISFGVSECPSCRVRYRYEKGRAIAEPEPPAPIASSSNAPIPLPATPLALVVVIALGANGAIKALSFALQSASLTALPLLASGSTGASAMTTFEILSILIAGADFLIFMATAALFLVWMQGANRDARALGAYEMRFTPGWCVLSWFIPFANLIRPYHAMVELWRASEPTQAEDWNTRPRPVLLLAWWLGWIAMGVLGLIALNPRYGRITVALRELVGFADAVLAGWIVWSVNARLREKALALLPEREAEGA